MKKHKKIKQPLSTEEIQVMDRQKIAKTLLYNQMLWYRMIIETFDQSFNKKPQDKY